MAPIIELMNDITEKYWDKLEFETKKQFKIGMMKKNDKRTDYQKRLIRGYFSLLQDTFRDYSTDLGKSNFGGKTQSQLRAEMEEGKP